MGWVQEERKDREEEEERRVKGARLKEGARIKRRDWENVAFIDEREKRRK
jgi:hypothetical protein